MKNNSSRAIGIIFILIGVGALLSTMNYMNHNVIMLMISIAFFALYFVRGGNKNYYNLSLLMPACILLMLSPLETLRTYSFFNKLDSEITILAIATAFFLMYFMHNFWVRDIRNRKRHWPLLVGIVLSAVGISNYISNTYDVAVGNFILHYAWSFIFILLGIFILIKEFFKKKL
ncbi:MAG: hypothetical protein H7Y18_07215 [Clostridiaceae bacterium]|nr:hypothetical protein [Clostridiaceae bacterium]